MNGVEGDELTKLQPRIEMVDVDAVHDGAGYNFFARKSA